MSEILAFHGGPKTVNKKFPWPVFDEAEINAVTRVMRAGAWGDPDCAGEVRLLEEEFARYIGAKHALAVVNGSVALRVALLAAGIEPGDEVIVPPYTFYATASIVVEANGVPVFADMEDDTYCMDPARIEQAITSRTRAIIPVHFGGQASNMERILEIARKHGIAVIEDACHAHGAEYKGAKMGSLGDVGCFSFQSSKNMTAGEGGMIVTSDDRLYDLMFSLRNCGRVRGGVWYNHQYLGCNYRITSMQAAILREQLKRLEAQTQKRDKNGRFLNELLSKIPGIRPLARGRGETLHSYHLYVFRYDKSRFADLPKKDFVEMLTAEGVPSSAGYPLPLYKQRMFLEHNCFSYKASNSYDYSQVRCPVTERACEEEAVWIPHQALLGEKEDMELFAQAIRKIQANVTATVAR
jgi:dTDP-4-amino-4,6-dideoxygalactose transaminase